MGILIGGLLPAVFYGVSSTFTKASTNAGISTAYYTLFVGLSIVLASGLVLILSSDSQWHIQSASYAGLSGLFWFMGTACVTFALSRYHMPIGKLVPIFNLNTLVAVSLGLLVFSEWKELNTLKLLVGAILVCIGGSLVATS